MKRYIYQNLLADNSKVSKASNKLRFFAFWFVIFFSAFFSLYALGLVPNGAAEIGDLITYHNASIAKGISGIKSVLAYGAEIREKGAFAINGILENSKNFISDELSAFRKVLPSEADFAAANLSRFFAYFESQQESELKARATPSVSSIAPAASEFQNSGYQKVILDSAQIVIPAIEVDTPIIFPQSAEIDVLNEALLRGAVHYPGSALPGEKGNIFIFGHSTGLAVVYNKSFEVFNRLKELKTGDIIQILAEGREYRYRALSMKIAEADEVIVDLNSKKQMLVLSTCRIFGHDAKNDRFVVEAEFAGNYPLPN